MRRLKIDVLTNLYPPDVLGGYELLTRDVVHGLVDRGHTVHVLTTGAGSGEPGVTRSLRLARRFGEAPRADRVRHLVAAIRNRISVRRHLRRAGRPDVLLVMSQRRLGLEPLREFHRAGVPVMATVNDDWPAAYGAPRRGAPWLRALERRLTAFKLWRRGDLDRVMWLSAAVRRAVLDAGAPLSSGRVRYQGVDCSLFTPGPRARSAARPLTLLFVGRLHPSKGPDVALEALANVRSRGRAAELVIVGEADDPAYDAALRQQAAQLGVTAHVTWRGKLNREQLPDVYRSADVFLFVSRLAHEGQGLTYLEAMACGVPVVASPSGGAREFLTQYPIARLTAACDGVSFGDEILKIADDSVDTTRLAAAAMVTVREHASLDAYIDVIEQELSSMSCVTKH